ncbi:hypothetical protein CEXT_789751 [Caerostris extrusa]|uniref:Ribosomal protein L2 n=1 Tax=Caerostris extrusa TaxID=172846 RepID=A0AAV4YG77_CAEEX|nr:hypothetical protein CEXT_789751 [Caerostris extrusa]
MEIVSKVASIEIMSGSRFVPVGAFRQKKTGYKRLSTVPRIRKDSRFSEDFPPSESDRDDGGCVKVASIEIMSGSRFVPVGAFGPKKIGYKKAVTVPRIRKCSRFFWRKKKMFQFPGA